MKPYHEAWLSAHPERSRDWLETRLKDGFDIHHIDGDANNDNPSNLVLIECGDHLMLHNGKTRLSRLSPRDVRKRRAEPRLLKVPDGVIELRKGEISRWVRKYYDEGRPDTLARVKRMEDL